MKHSPTDPEQLNASNSEGVQTSLHGHLTCLPQDGMAVPNMSPPGSVTDSECGGERPLFTPRPCMVTPSNPTVSSSQAFCVWRWLSGGSHVSFHHHFGSDL